MSQQLSGPEWSLEHGQYLAPSGEVSLSAMDASSGLDDIDVEHFRCGECSALTPVSPNAYRVTCENCGWHRRFASCPSCEMVAPHPVPLVSICDVCDERIHPERGLPAAFWQLGGSPFRVTGAPFGGGPGFLG